MADTAVAAVQYPQQHIFRLHQIRIQLTADDQLRQGEYPCKQNVRQPEGSRGQPPEHHDLPHRISPDLLPQPEQDKPLYQNARIVQHHENDIHQKRNLIDHFPHNIIF